MEVILALLYTLNLKLKYEIPANRVQTRFILVYKVLKKFLFQRYELVDVIL